ncbi:hypothetical protein [Austwickia sp. TVS 96-490-7B]|uniref:hypothetical protein n=1 Tax=Austwickia sp. TVS 96-490-7B TaxID=2830843 RepID=UPI001C585094|nr:hypothetical protein [Austwickia sp. TVS 96-490-7B]
MTSAIALRAIMTVRRHRGRDAVSWLLWPVLDGVGSTSPPPPTPDVPSSPAASSATGPASGGAADAAPRLLKNR